MMRRDITTFEKKYGILSKEELEYIKDHEFVKKVDKIMDDTVKHLLNIRDKQKNKYVLIEKIIESYHKGYCPRCGHWLSSPNKGLFDEPHTCSNCKGEFMLHELPSHFIWSIDNVINERVEKL